MSVSQKSYPHLTFKNDDCDLSQFLNSVLSSIGGEAPKHHVPFSPPVRPLSTPVDNAGIRGPLVSTSPFKSTSAGVKRKAEDDLGAAKDKFQKNGSANGLPTPVPRPKAAATPSPGILSRQSSSLGPKPQILQSAGRNAATTSTGPQISANVADEVLKEPKKGSYAEIMARAKATQSKPPAIGVISHKPKEQTALTYKKALKMKQKAMKDKKLGIKVEKRPSSSGSMSSTPAPGNTEAKKAIKPGYKGTAKPKVEPTYKGTMKPGSSIEPKAKPRNRAGDTSKVRYDEYAATDEDDLDDVEEDGYGSYESDDMEAGFSDVEQEESAAAKAARKEDEEEAKLEAKLKNEKEERKRRLAMMAKKAKPQRY